MKTKNVIGFAKAFANSDLILVLICSTLIPETGNVTGL